MTESTGDSRHVLRSHRHRYRPRRLCVRHPRGAARSENRRRRKERDLRRHLPQCRLHPVEGAAARLRALRGSRHQLCADGHQGRQAERRVAGAAQIQGTECRGQREGRRVFVQEEQDRDLPRRRPHRRSRPGRGQRRQRQDADARDQEHRHRHRLGRRPPQRHRRSTRSASCRRPARSISPRCRRSSSWSAPASSASNWARCGGGSARR